jgi:serine phosphatase RsbU (regulator of sigma subunit)
MCALSTHRLPRSPLDALSLSSLESSAPEGVRVIDLSFAADLCLATKQSTRLGESGDLFEVFDHGDGYVSMVVADVCGNGAAAARIADRVSPLLHSRLVRGKSPGLVLAALNETFTSCGWLKSFVTAVAVRIDVLSGLVEVACAGHMGPFIRRASGQVQALNGATGVPLGLVPDETYDEITAELDPEDALVLVTDGMTDPLSTSFDTLGEAGLLRRLRAAPHVTAGICDALLSDGTLVRDDATVLVMQLPARRGDASGRVTVPWATKR